MHSFIIEVSIAKENVNEEYGAPTIFIGDLVLRTGHTVMAAGLSSFLQQFLVSRKTALRAQKMWSLKGNSTLQINLT